MNSPHGGVLKDLLERDRARLQQLQQEAVRLPVITLTARQLCDLEMIMNGAFSPLEGFMSKRDYESVLSDMRLSNGLLWTIPIYLDVSAAVKDNLELAVGSRVALKDPRNGDLLAILNVSDIYQPDKSEEAKLVYGDNDVAHPSVQYLHRETGDYYLGGGVDALQLPVHEDYAEFRLTPAQLRAKLIDQEWTKVCAFQTRNPMHRAHRELTVRAARQNDAKIVIQPVVGLTKPGDVDYHTRVRVYKAILKRYPENFAMLALLPLAMRMGGPREAVWHSIIRKNYGFTHFIVGRDHAGPGKNSKGEDFYGPYQSRELALKLAGEIGIQIVPFSMVAYVPAIDQYVPQDELQDGVETMSISGTELRRRLQLGLEIPEWFTYPEVVQILREAYPQPQKSVTVDNKKLDSARLSEAENTPLVNN
ncbi:hypothetical protein MP228_008938 [Amoeboaphelidium protococcarum]|nr:hypothetical protein MP228_008938 [Amoeboaphelidium protococcarum]